VDTSAITGAVTSGTGNAAIPNLPVALPRAASRSAVDVVQGVIADIQPAADAIVAVVSIKADIQVDIVVAHLKQIVVVLQKAVDDVKIIVANPVGFVTSVNEVAAVLALLIVLVLKVLFLVSTTVGLAHAAVINPLIATIGGLLATLLGLIIPLAAGVVALLIVKIYHVISFVYILNLKAIVQVLGLPDLF
jgi:S-methylmethionine-dependent homocysteine/selenocysteine methylase